MRRIIRGAFLQTASGADLDLLVQNLYGVSRQTLESDRSVRRRCREKLVQIIPVDPVSEARRVLRVPVRVVSTSWEPGLVVLEAKRPWWRRRSTWARMVAEAEKAAERVRFAGVRVEIRTNGKAEP
jgi:hypothetical protein